MAHPTRYGMIVRWSEPDGSFLVEVPELLGYASDGPTPAEAVANAEVVARQWIEVARDRAVRSPSREAA